MTIEKFIPEEYPIHADPITFLQGLLMEKRKNFEFDIDVYDIERFNSDEPYFMDISFTIKNFKRKRFKDTYYNNEITIWFESCKQIGDIIINGLKNGRPVYENFNPFFDNTKSLGEIGEGANLSFSYFSYSKDINIDLVAQVKQVSPGIFKLDEQTFYQDLDLVPTKKEIYGEVEINEIYKFIQKEDYRPYLHRMVEVWSEIPKKEWHDSRIYDFQTNLIDQNIDYILTNFFSGNEKNQLEKRLQEAKLKIGRWTSVPNLNLGLIKLPTPSNDNYAIKQGQLFIEVLSSLNIMTREEAHKSILPRLIRHYVHDSGFQKSKEKAREIVDSLREQNHYFKIANI